MAPRPEELCLSQQPGKLCSLKKAGREGRTRARIWAPAVSRARSSSLDAGPRSPERGPAGPAALPPRKHCRRSHADFWKGFPEIPGFPECGGLSKGDVSELSSDKGPPGRERRRRKQPPPPPQQPPRGEGQRRRPYRGRGVGLGAVLQQDVDDVRVALLGGLVQRRVAVLLVTVAADPAQICSRRRKARLAFILNFLVLFTTNPPRMPFIWSSGSPPTHFSAADTPSHLMVC